MVLMESICNNDLYDNIINNKVYLEIPNCKFEQSIDVHTEKNDYNSWLVVEAEQDPKKANPFEYAKKGYSYLKKTATKAGFEIIE